MIIQLGVIQKSISIIGLLCILVLYFTNQLVPVEYLSSVAFCFLIHLFAFVLSIDLFNYLKIPFTFYFSFLSMITYGIAPFFIDRFDFQLGYLDFNVYGILNFSFFLFYFFYFFITYKKIKNQIFKNLNLFVPKFSFQEIKYYFLFFYITIQFVSIPISAFNEYIEFFSCGLIFIGFLTNKNKRFENIFLTFFVSFISLKLLLSGLIYLIIYFAFYLFTIFIVFYNFTFRKIFPLFIYFISIIAFAILFSSIKMKYRQLSPDLPTLYEKTNLIKDLLIDDFKFSYVTNEQKVKDGPIWRLSYPLSAFSQVTIMTPAVVPYWDGESYSVILYKIIPRFLFPDKPTENMGQIFGHRYNFLSSDNFSTSMNSPILAEAYMNFGYSGVCMVVIIMAFAFSNLFFQLNLKNKPYSDLFISISVIHLAILSVYFIQWESNFSMLFGKCLILYIFDKLVKKIIFTSL